MSPGPDSEESLGLPCGEGICLPSVHLGFDAQAGVGVLCHLGEPGAPAGEVDGRRFLASCLHAAVSGGRLSAETGRPLRAAAPGVPVAPSPPAPAAGPVAAGREASVGRSGESEPASLGRAPRRADVCEL